MMKSLQVDGEALKGDSDLSKDNGEALKGGDEVPNNFHSLEVVDRVSETQLQVGENSNWIIWRLKG